MKKAGNYVLGAGAALCCSLGFAQSSVQVYGLVDVGLAYSNGIKGATAAAPAGHVLKIESGNASSSRLGFRGREDLGGGLSALFVLEEGIAADSGSISNGGRAFGRASYVALAGSLGQIQLGREPTPYYDFGVKYDPVAPAKFAGPVDDAAWISRADNAVKYVGKFGGLKVQAQYSLGYDSTITNGGEQPEFQVGKELGLYADYTSGPLTVGVVYDNQNGTTVATQSNRNQHTALAAIYDFKAFKLYATYALQRLTTSGIATEVKGGWVGASFPVGPLAIATAVYVRDPDGPENRSVMPAVFASYFLSKTTDIYAEVAYMKNDRNATLGLISAANPGGSQTGFTFGLRKRF